jgi:membrane protein YdbS with pleckstrin-like domain
MDPRQHRLMWRRYAQWMGVAAAVLLAMGVFGLLLAWLVTGHRPTVVIVLLIFIPIVLVVGALGVRWVLARRGVRWAQPSPMLVMEPQERRQLMRALRRNDPIPAEQHETAKSTLRQLQWSMRLNLVSMGVLVAINILNATDAPGAHLRWLDDGLATLLAVTFSVSVWLLIRYRRTARRLKAQTREETTDGTGVD